MAKVTTAEKNRIFVMFCIFLLLMLVVVGALVYYQLIRGAEFKEKAIEQQTRDQLVEAKRGQIYDRNMKVLAQSASCEDVMVNPRQIQAAKAKQDERRAQAFLEGVPFNEEDVVEVVVKGLVEVLGVDEAFVRKEVSLDYASRRIKKKVEPSVANRLREMKLTGVFFQETTKRYYPYSSFASHVIGFTGDDGDGLEGLEKMLDPALSGTAGRIQVVQDVNNNLTPYEYENYIPPEDGNGVVLTIDEVIQHYVEKYLEEAYNLYDIRNGAAAIVMDPNTGEILAMAVEPNFDLNAPRKVDSVVKLNVMGLKDDGTEYTDGEYLNRVWRNKAVVDSYEPGSTFKSIVAAAAVESGVVNPATDGFYCTGSRKVAVHTIHCHKRAGHGQETFIEALENSCNPAFMEMGARLGYKNFRAYYEAFGFTSKTDFVLPGESKGIFFTEKNFNEAELATSSFGQGFQITPLQMITAFSAVVNGGKLYKPQLVKAYTNSEGDIVENVEATLVREVISENTSRVMRAALESVVANGTGNAAYVDGYRIGGKTGTSEKQPRGQGKYVASFVGFAPADDPQLVCLLILDEPGGALTGGGAIAAPAVGKILADSLSYLGYEPVYTDNSADEVEVPNAVGMTTWDAKKLIEKAGLTVTIQGEGAIVNNQLPKGTSHLAKGGLVILYTEATEEVRVEIPSFIGMTKAQTVTKAQELNLNIEISGGGMHTEVSDTMLAISQSTPAGTSVMPGSVITVDFAENTNEFYFDQNAGNTN
ncbi:MAG: PASTA domain-containing protein [Clostridia bacterium]|nr:PASTA domain-containing protein [Clostridia bacterium]